MSIFNKDSLQMVLKASLEAGDAIMQIYDKFDDFGVVLKDDESPLTIADKKSNDIINSYLKQTGIPIISEENEAIDFSLRKNWESFWVVDPLDGTKEFIKKNGEFTVNIALIVNGVPEFGVIVAPACNVMYFGIVEEGKAYRVDLDVVKKDFSNIYSEAVEIKPKNEGDLTIVSSRSHINKETQDFIEEKRKEGNKVEIVSKGSSLKFCLVAEGKANVYPRYAPTMEWDTAAGHAICNSVGIAVLSKETNKELMYNKENLLNPSFLVSNV